MFWWLWGATGAFLFGASALAMSLWAECPEGSTQAACKRARGLAATNFAIAVVTGAVLSQALTPILHRLLEQGITVQGVAFKVAVDASVIALGIGWSGNTLWPTFLRKAVNFAEKLGDGPK